MTIGIHQPEYLPWLGFFDKMDQCDTFVLLDTVQFSKNNFQNRNKTRVNNNKEGFSWLTVPVVKASLTTLIKDKQISNTMNWRGDHWRHIELWYVRAPYFSKYKRSFQAIYEKEWDSLSKLNIALIFTIRELLGIDTELLIASDLSLNDRNKGGTEGVFNICESLGATAYLSGQGGKDYLDEMPFRERGIEVKYQNFHHPVYNQRFNPFIPRMSIIDLLFNEGDEALKIIRMENSRETD
ncbi:WbqC family protein [Chloroflexota bacterium]